MLRTTQGVPLSSARTTLSRSKVQRYQVSHMPFSALTSCSSFTLFCSSKCVENDAYYEGGAMDVYFNNTLEIENSTITRKSYANQCLDLLFWVLLIWLWKCVENKAREGGAICMYSNNTLNVENSTISRKSYAMQCFNYLRLVILIWWWKWVENDVWYKGGAVSVDSDNTLRIVNSTLSGKSYAIRRLNYMFWVI